jgi:3-oxoacyl-[acyl-carrier protein] reductase
MGLLDGRVAVITGGAEGIGAAVARAFVAEGARVGLCDVQTTVVSTASELGGESVAIGAICDVTSEDDVVEAAQRFEAQLGPIDVWINNAGISRPAMLHKMEMATFDAVLSTHVRGTFLGMRTAARQMIAHENGGAIINVTSSAGLQGTIGQVNYAAAKGAITAMTKSAALELARYDIRVNAVAPVAATTMTEAVRTDPRWSGKYLDRIPMRRFADPSEVASGFVYLASAASSFVTGQVLCVDGGMYMAS